VLTALLALRADSKTEWNTLATGGTIYTKVPMESEILVVRPKLTKSMKLG